MNTTLDNFIRTKTNFITDFEEIVDIISSADQVYLYDTSAISTHELGFYQHMDLSFFHYSEHAPILVTDTILHETRIIEDTEERYLRYLSNFNQILYIKEADLLELLKIDYELKEAKINYLTASEKAFSSIQRLKDSVRAARKQFNQQVEQIIYEAYDSFFLEVNHANRGEISLLWLSTIIEKLPGNCKVTFFSIDSDLKDFVERSYLKQNNSSPFAKEITLCSNETLLQSLYRMDVDPEELDRLIAIYRSPDRKTYYFKKVKQVMNLIQQNEKIPNSNFKNAIIQGEIEIIY